MDTTNFENYAVLIIDDNPNNLGVIADYLDEYGFRILVALDGEEGITKASYARPDIILLDVMMPMMDGFETCQRLKKIEETKDIPIIFMTALSSTEDKVKGFAVGAVDYVTKPIQQEEVLARVTTHLKIRDLTQQLQSANKELTNLTSQLQEANKRLTKLNADKDKFFAIVGHDLKGPFMPLLGMAELLSLTAEEIYPPSVRASVKETGEAIHRSAKNVYNLLENLLQWSRMQQGRMEYRPGKLDLRVIAEQNVSLLAENASKKGITLQSKVAKYIFVYADEHMLNTVVRNLINNALKFTMSQGQVTVKATIKRVESDALGIAATLMPSFVEIAVADTGIGMSKADSAKLFKIEVHHSTTGTAKEQGTGLGLILCKEMVELNGGQIWVESELGEGTTVKFTIPLDSSTDVETVGKADASVIPNSQSLPQTLLTAPPRQKMATLLNFATVGDMRGIEEETYRIEQMGEQYILFACKLRELVKGFEEEKLLALIEECCH